MDIQSFCHFITHVNNNAINDENMEKIKKIVKEKLKTKLDNSKIMYPYYFLFYSYIV